MKALNSNHSKEEMTAWLTIAFTIADVFAKGLYDKERQARVDNARKQAEVLVNEVERIGEK